ncbi:MAG: TetR/AcrR family transcriptional regulator [Acidimicrobiales bacterium]|nr:TetR/AcrR family transcriptional regulator [Acidimicrobiales bacterium]
MAPTRPDMADIGSTATDVRRVTDGRHRRSEQSKAAIVNALLSLIREGNLRPSSAQIAERAGVTQRTLFNHFGDMDALLTAVARQQAQLIYELLPTGGDGSLDERIDQFSDELARLLEELLETRWAVVTNPNLPMTSTVVSAFTKLLRDATTNAFKQELAQLNETEREEVLDTLGVECDPVTWRVRRRFQGLSYDRARFAVRRTFSAVLHDALA